MCLRTLKETLKDRLSQEEEGGDFFDKELDRLEKGRKTHDRPACLLPENAVNEFKALGRLKDQDVWNVIPSYPTAVRPCSLALAALPVTQVSVERPFSARGCSCYRAKRVLPWFIRQI